MTKLGLLFDLMVGGIFPIFWVKLLSITHGMNFFSGSILHLKCDWYD